MRRLCFLFLLCGAAFAQTYTTVTIAPNPAASAVGQLRFVEKSNSPTRKYLSFEGPDSLGGNVRYKFSGSTTAGCLTVGALSGGVYPVTSASCPTFPLVFPSGTASPQIDATGLAAALNVNGSSTSNGNIVFNPGNVAGNAAVYINTPRLDWPGLILQNKTGTTTGDVFEILDSAGAAQVRVTGSANATAPSSIFLGLPTNSLGLVGPSLVAQNVIASLSAATNGSGISMAATPSSGGADLSVFKTGSGTLLPLRFFRNPTEVARFDTSNRFLIARTSDDGTGSIFQVAGDASVSGAIYAGTGFASTNSASNTLNIPNGGLLALNGTFGSVSNYIIVQGTSPQVDATALGAAFNFNGSATSNGNIVFNPGSVTGLSSVVVNGHSNGVTTQSLIINEAGAPTGAGITMKHAGTFDAAWQAGSSAAFDVVDSGSTHRFVIDQSGHVLVARTSDDGTGAKLQVNGAVSISGTATADIFTATTGFSSVNSASNTINIPNGGILATNGTFGVSPNYIVVQHTSPQIDATSLGAAFNFNGASATNGNIVFNPGNVTALSSVVVNGHSNGVTTQSLIINEAGAPTGAGITMKHAGTFDAAWQAGSSAAFDVVDSGSTHRFVIDQSGHVLVARTSDDGTGAKLQVNGAVSISGALTVASCTGCGGGGSSPVFDSGTVTGQSGSVTVNLTVSGGMAPAGYYRINAYLGCDVGHTSGASQADVFPLFARSSGSAFVEALTPGVNSLRCGSSSSGSAFEFALPPMLIYTDGSAHLQFVTIAVGFASAQLYNYRVYLERF